MTIDLYVSSTVHTSARKIAELLSVQCQITNNISRTKSDVIEQGYHIKLIDFDRSNFKRDIWEPLKELLGIQCAFVKDDDYYMGCVLNWPSVFVRSRCAATTPEDRVSLTALEEGINCSEMPITEPSSTVCR